MESLLRKAAKFMQSRRKNKRWRNLVTCLAAVVVFGTTYALILPAITIDDETAEQEAGLVLIQDGDAAQEEKQETSLTDKTYPEDSEDVIDQNDVAIGAAEEEQESDGLNEFPADLQMIDIFALDAETKTLSFEGADYKVTVTYDESAGIPEGASLQAEEIEAESEEYASLLATASQTLEEQDTYIHKARFFDISILDGENEIEPASAVDVQISLAAEENIDTDALIVTHEDELISTVDTTEEEDGTVTLAFETESFSDYGVISSGGSQTISVGDTVTLQGTSSYSTDSWSVSAEGIVSLSESDNTTAIVTGLSAGTVKVTHTYYKNKSKTETEQFTITVTESEDTTTLTGTASGYTVTVKGNTKVLTDDVTLHVEDYAETASDYQAYYNALVADLETAASKDTIDFDFLHMYHIYLTKTGVDGEYVPEDNVNLQVTITYDTAPANWDKVNWVGHYKKSNGTVNRQAISDGSNSSSGVKQIKVSGNSITFHIQSFSVFPVAALAGDEGDDSGGGSSSSGTITSESGSLSSTETGMNSFQISQAGYYRSTNGARMKKIIEPTDIEDVFKVTVTIEREPTLDELKKVLEAAGGLVLQSNSNAADPGTVIDEYGQQEHDSQLLNIDHGTGYLLITFKTSKGDVTVKLYAEEKANGGQYHGALIPLPNGKWISVNHTKMSFKNATATTFFTSSVDLTQNGLEDILFDAVSPSFDSVTDTIDTSRFTYIGATEDTSTQTNPTTDLGSAEYSNGVITWNGVSGLAANDSQNNVDNSKTMTYYVKLNTTGIDAMSYSASGPDTSSGTAYKEGEAVANISVNTTGFDGNTSTTQKQFTITEPSVKGLLYYISLKKQDKDDSTKLLSGAEFAVYAGNATRGTPVATITTDGNGYGVSTPGLPWGEYTLVETKAPSGYKLPNNPTVSTYKLGYVESRKTDTGYVAEVVDSNKPGKNLTDDPISNEKASIKVILKKVATGTNGTPLSDAVFTLYKEDSDSAETITVGNDSKNVTTERTGLTSGDDGIFYTNASIENGTYYLVETTAPDGYNKLADAVTFTVSADGVQATDNYIKVGEPEVDDDGVTTYTISVTNSTGYKLPDTGGSGTIWFTFGGLAILAGCLMAGFRMRRKRERRSY
ncbi:MAG: SpaA isopeptide-forming pilin-related protein [Eubacteriales bacterium]|nr:SpaA isopeptide-forming pilin-related protein [Eubacteriales bacterium]